MNVSHQQLNFEITKNLSQKDSKSPECCVASMNKTKSQTGWMVLEGTQLAWHEKLLDIGNKI